MMSVTGRTGSLIKPTDPDFATDGLVYRGGRFSETPGGRGLQRSTIVSKRPHSDQERGPDHVAGTFDRRRRLAEQAAEERRIKEQEALARREERERRPRPERHSERPRGRHGDWSARPRR